MAATGILVDANATYVDASQTSINIKINGRDVRLSIDDCIQYDRETGIDKSNDKSIDKSNPWKWKSTVSSTISKIIGFGNTALEYVNRIFLIHWDKATGKWGRQNDSIGLQGTMGSGDWRTIVKLDKCPEQAGGRRRNRRATKKKARRNYRRSSRRN